MGLQLSSGRVIGLGRLLLAILFFFALWLELGRPAQAPVEAMVLAIGYLFFSAAILIATWSDWWLDSRLAGAAHTLDIVMFTLMVLLTHGYTSPFFTFFVFVLLSSAIRWGWRATALTAVLVSILYLMTGLLVSEHMAEFDVQHFIVRTGHLFIFSCILIWFGITQWRTRAPAPARPSEVGIAHERPLDVLRAAAADLRAARGAAMWRDHSTARVAAARFDEHGVTPVVADGLAAPLPWPALPFLYDLRKDRALKRDTEGDLRNFRPNEVLPFETTSALALEQGFAIPVSSDAGDGLLFAEGIHALSTDDLERGEQISADAAAQLQRNALLRAAEDRAAGRSRTSLARDLHDSVVQFLAGAAFRLEAMKRGSAAGTQLVAEIDELKQLMLHEQGELRAFISALRSGSRVAMSDVASELRVLADRLAKHWGVTCAFTAEPVSNMIVPARLHLDAQQLVREAVANAVRHAGARVIDVRLSADSRTMRLEVINDGAAYPKSKEGGRMPQSLRERVEEVGGIIELSRGMGVTRLSIALPVGGPGA